MKQNCWEYKKCGRQPGGSKVHELGICPATIDVTRNGRNGGKNAGRFCWRVAGTFCDGKVQGSFAVKFKSCSECDFYRLVRKEEGMSFEL